MGFIKDIGDKGIGTVIDQTTNLTIEALDRLIKIGFSDYSELEEMVEGKSQVCDKNDIMLELEKDPLNTKLRMKLCEVQTNSMEYSSAKIQEEILGIISQSNLS